MENLRRCYETVLDGALKTPRARFDAVDKLGRTKRSSPNDNRRQEAKEYLQYIVNHPLIGRAFKERAAYWLA